MSEVSRQPIIYNPFADDPVSFIYGAIAKGIYEIQTCIPAIVKKVIDRNTVIATPAVQQLNANQESVAWADIELPVHTPCGSNLIISAPLTVGDTGWIIAGDLDPSLFLKKPSEPAQQNIYSRHEYQFGFFVPCKFGKYEVEIEDGVLYLGTNNGDTKITVKDGEIIINSKSDLKINAETVNITGSNKVEINGTDWESHTHGVGTLTTTATVGASTTLGVLSGSTGGVD